MIQWKKLKSNVIYTLQKRDDGGVYIFRHPYNEFNPTTNCLIIANNVYSSSYPFKLEGYDWGFYRLPTDEERELYLIIESLLCG